MFESPSRTPAAAGRAMTAPKAGRVTATVVRAWISNLSGEPADLDDPARLDLIRALEELKSAAAAAQAVTTVDLVASQRAGQIAAGVPAERVGAGVSAQVALARRESPHRGGQHVGLAQALVTELPGTLAELRAGRTSEWRATLVARATACLDPVDRRLADAELSEGLAGWGDRETEAMARRVAYRLDPEAFVARTRAAAKDRRVTLRPAPDTMARLSGLLPVAQGVAAFAALAQEADRLRADGDPRSRSQMMADVLVQRLTGQSAADAVPVEVHVVMTEESLLRDGDEPADLVGLGPVPAASARDLILRADAEVFLRRLFTRPDDGALVAMESRRQHFPEGLRRLLIVRDQVCRTPWCGAPVRHADHVVRAAVGGPTSSDNGQGLCEACNYAKDAPGWRVRPGPVGAGDVVETVTPTGHRYESRPPPLVGDRDRSSARRAHRRLVTVFPHAAA